MIGRRDLLRQIGCAGMAGAVAALPRPAAAEPPPETTTVRLLDHPVLCLAPQYIAEELLKAEGITDVRYEKDFTSMFVAHVGLDPRRDIEWIVRPFPEMPALLADSTVGAFLVDPTFSQELRERKVGKVLVNTTTDKPWSQYLCCLIAARRDYVQRHPVATKRILRALLKANDLCAREPEPIARQLAARRPGIRYEHALQMLGELPYARWRQYDPEDTMRFFALRMHEAGLIRSNPQKIIARGADWRFVHELRRELKG